MNYNSIEFGSLPVKRPASSILFDLTVEDTGFPIYHNLFENYIAEEFRRMGSNVSVKKIPIQKKPIENNSLIKDLVGENIHSINRLQDSYDFFDKYIKYKDTFFSKKIYLNTKYIRRIKEEFYSKSNYINNSYLNKQYRKYSINKLLFLKAKRFVILYQSMKDNPYLLNGNNKKIQYYNLPYVINYNGYLKYRDGAHRRAISSYLGCDYVYSLELNFSIIKKNSLKQFHNNYIYNNYEKYKNVIDSCS